MQVANNIKEGDFFIPQLGPFRSAVRWAFNSKTGSVSEPLETESFYAVFKLDSIIPKGIERFENVKNSIYKEIFEDNEFDATSLFAQEIKSKVQSGISFESFKETNNRLELIPSDKKNLNSSFISLGRSDQLVGALLKSNVGDILGPVKTSRGHGVVKVLNIEEFDSTKWKNSKEGLRAELLTRKEREAYSEWMKDLREDADIVDNRKYHF